MLKYYIKFLCCIYLFIRKLLRKGQGSHVGFNAIGLATFAEWFNLFIIFFILPEKVRDYGRYWFLFALFLFVLNIYSICFVILRKKAVVKYSHFYRSFIGRLFIFLFLIAPEVLMIIAVISLLRNE